MKQKMGRTLLLAMLASLVEPAAVRAQGPSSLLPGSILPTDSIPPQRDAATDAAVRDASSPITAYDFLVDDTPPQQEGMLYPAGQKLGWFGGFGAGLVKPHINSHVTSGTLLAPTFTTPLQLPTAPLAWTGMPQVDAGYRLAQGAGEFLASYRFLASEGSTNLPAFDLAGAGYLKSRLNVNRFNFSYVNHEFLIDRMPNLFRDVWAGAGVSAANVFFDSQARGAQILNMQATNNFAGVGPYGAFGLDKQLGQSPCSLYGRLDAAGLIGKTRQHFEETAVTPRGLVSAAASSGSQSNGVGLPGSASGVCYTPGQPCTRLRFLARLPLGAAGERAPPTTRMPT